MLNTLFFIIGISFAFFLLGMGVSALGSFFRESQTVISRIGGAVIFLFGIYQLFFFGRLPGAGKEHRLPVKVDVLALSPLTALVLGFTFSFAWTPCVGPALTSVLLMTASASAKLEGLLLIGVYTLGFVLPFLAVGLFTTTLLEFFKKHQKVVKYTVKIGAVLLICIGLLMVTDKMNSISGYLAGLTSGSESGGSGQENGEDMDSTETTDGTGGPSGSEEEEIITVPAIDFTLTDQYGNTHTLSDYKGKTVFLNFWATWCRPCKNEMPDIQKIYETYDAEGEDALVVLAVAAPGYGWEGTQEDVEQFLKDNGYTYPVVMDISGEIFSQYGIVSLPTTFMIDREGNVFGYIEGQLNMEMMESIISQTLEGVRR